MAELKFKGQKHPGFWVHASDLHTIGSQIRGGDISVSFGRANTICPTTPQVMPVVKNPPARTRDLRDVHLISVLGRFPGGGNGNPFQYFWLENRMDRGNWQATVHDRLSMQAPANYITALYF